jgi:8-oxo-dGTP diphosphatase
MLKKFHVILAVGAFIINDKEEILIVKKSPAEHIDAGLWTIPGGKIDPDEAIIEGLKREVKEEVNLDIDFVRWIGEDVFESSGFYYHAQHFLCKPLNFDVKLEHKLLEYRWIKKEEIGKYEFPDNIKKRIIETL